MAYLRLQDYFNFRIQEQQLNQITQGNSVVRQSCELEAEAEMISYLVQRYDIDDEFRDVGSFVNYNKYYANNLFELNATAYSDTSTYLLNENCLYQGKVYVCTTVVNIPESFNPSKWQLVGNQYDLYYIASPYPRYSYNTTYRVGDIVYYKNKIYKCNVSVTNIIPTDIDKGSYYWSTGVDYMFEGQNIYLSPSYQDGWSNTTIYNQWDLIVYGNNQLYYCVKDNNLNVVPSTDINSWLPITWVKGDNRSQQLVAFLIDIVLYKIHMRIAPNNIPQLRKDNYTYCLDWLMQAGGQNNAITANIPLLQPKQGARIRWGSNVKNYNNY